jgi:hypothetical protein
LFLIRIFFNLPPLKFLRGGVAPPQFETSPPLKSYCSAAPALAATHIVVPVAVETLGPWNDEGLDFMRELGRRTSLITRDPRETSWLLKRISIAVQRGNAASCIGSLPTSEGEADG